MAKTDRPDKIKVDDVQVFVNEQLLGLQISWMDHSLHEEDTLAASDAAVIDKLYEFANTFYGQEIPAPGQGYEPPAKIWAAVERDRELARIDAQIAELTAQRQAIERA